MFDGQWRSSAPKAGRFQWRWYVLHADRPGQLGPRLRSRGRIRILHQNFKIHSLDRGSNWLEVSVRHYLAIYVTKPCPYQDSSPLQTFLASLNICVHLFLLLLLIKRRRANGHHQPCHISFTSQHFIPCLDSHLKKNRFGQCFIIWHCFSNKWTGCFD